MRKANASGKIPGRPDNRNWFRNQAKKAVYVNVDKLLKDPKTVSNMEPGKLYMFAYDPKHKAKLPYYDAYPLIFPFAVKGNQIWGINLHYLPPKARALLMDELIGLVDNRFKNDNKKLRISYEILNGVSKFDAFRPCIKSYLTGHFRSKFLLIPYDEWDIALTLPTARFQKASQAHVWDESMDIVNGNSF